MRTDNLGRRLRFERTPKDKSFILTERDLILFEALHRHGPLPANYLYEFTRSHCRSELHLKHRLTKLYHGLVDGSYFLERPPQQYRTCLAWAQQNIYDLAPAAKVVLAEAGRLSPYVAARGDHFLHKFMAACVSASIALTAAKSGIRYIHRHEIFSHSRCPENTRGGPKPLALSAAGKTIIPDELFGLDYGGKFRFFVVECDRNTESIERKNLGQSAFGRKLKRYLEVLDRRTFRDVWGIPNLLVLVVTTNGIHMKNMIHHTRGLTSAHRDKILFHTQPEFGVTWNIPPVLDSLLTGRWMRTAMPFDISRP